ncbi:histidine kinase N-terminal 7TM domain-containing protein, partial [Halobium palmae]
MALQFTPYTPLLVLAGLISSALAAYGWRLRSAAEARWFALLTGAAAAWSFGYAIELSATTLGAVLFWERLVWAAYALVVAGLLLFSLEFAGYESSVTRRTLPLFFLPSALTIGMVFTTGTHGLVWSGAELVDAGGFVALRYGNVGAWYWVETAYGFGVCLFAVGLFSRRALGRRDLYRKQSLVMATGV